MNQRMILSRSQLALVKAFALAFTLCCATQRNLCFAQSLSAVTHEITVPSKIIITVKKDGSYTAESKTTDFVAYQEIPDGWKVHQVFPPRVATITTTYVANNGDEKTSVGVSVDDVSGKDIRRVSEFSDPGNTGRVVDGQLFVTTAHACCALPALHHVRFLETGKLLFQSSGDAEFGAAAFAEIPNVYPHVDRWAAFEAAGLFDKEDDHDVIGFITYGNFKGIISKIVLRSKDVSAFGDRQRNSRNLRQNAAGCGFVVWLVPGSDANKPKRPASGECSHFPGGSHISTELWHLAQQRADPVLSGFALEFSVLGRVYATIPITNDRFNPSRAHIDPDLTIEAVQATGKQTRPLER